MTVNVSKPAINVREKLAELDKPTGIAGEAMLRAETPQEQFNLIGAGRRNWIINGDFQVSQRGDYTSATSLTTAATYYVDRWAALLFSGAAGTIQKIKNQTLPNGVVTDSLKLLITTSAANPYALWQWVEDWNVFRGQETTISFWYKSNADQSFNYYTVAAQTHVSLPNTNGQWVYFNHTRKHESNTTGMRIEFFPIGVTPPNNTYLELAQVQLEVGKVATPFEHRSYGEELALCQRYYINLNTGNYYGLLPTSGDSYRHWVQVLPVAMRASPSVTGVGGNGVISNSAGTNTTLNINSNLGNSTSSMYFTSFKLDAEL
jgi:hypothetical protein